MRKIQIFWFFVIFSIIFTKFNIFYSWIPMIILHPIVSLKSKTPYFIIPKYFGSKSGNKIFYWWISLNLLKNLRKMKYFHIFIIKNPWFHFYFPQSSSMKSLDFSLSDAVSHVFSRYLVVKLSPIEFLSFNVSFVKKLKFLKFEKNHKFSDFLPFFSITFTKFKIFFFHEFIW